MEYQNDVTINFFGLYKDGDVAVVRLLHSSVDTIERKAVHYIKVAGKTKIVNCLGQDCVACQRATSNLDAASDRIFLHLYDYADNQEKVWNRTPTIIPQLQEIQNAWGRLSDCVLQITRVGNEFPKYNIVPLNPMNYAHAPVDQSRIDMNVAYRFYMTRSKDELAEFYNTGIMPAHKKVGQTDSTPQNNYVPREQYSQGTAGGGAYSNSSTSGNPPINSAPAQTTPMPPFASINVNNNPFATDFSNKSEPMRQTVNQNNDNNPFANFVPRRV